MMAGMKTEQAWEYSITHSDRLTNTAGIPQVSSIWRTKYADGSTDWDHIERMGRDGWELVSAFPIEGNGTTLYVTFIFRRPAPAAPPAPAVAPAAPEPPPSAA
jgi:hypothetical protein